MRQEKDPLISVIDAAVLTMLQLVDPSPTTGDNTAPVAVAETDEVPIGFADRVKAIELGIKWVAVKNKIDGGDDDDAFGRLRAGLVGGARGRRGAGAATTRPPNGA